MVASMHVGTLYADMKLNTAQYISGLKVAETKTKTSSASMVASIKTLAVPLIAIGGAFAGIGYAAVKSAEEIEDAYATIRVGTGATGDALKDLQADFDAVFGTVPNDAEQVSTAIADLNTRLGLTGDDLQSLSIQFLNLSRITNTDVSTAIRSITRLFGDWQVDAKDYVSTMDRIFNISQSTGIEISKLADLSVTYGTSLRGMGFDLEETTALLGTFEKEGVNVETIMASLKIGLANMAREGLTDANEAFKELIQRVKESDSNLSATTVAIEVFGSRAAADMALAIREGRFDIEDFNTELSLSTETINDAAEASLTFSDKMDTVSNKITERLAPVGEDLIDLFTVVVTGLDDIYTKYDEKMELVYSRNEGTMTKITQSQIEASEKIKPVWDNLWEYLTTRQAEADETRLYQQAAFASVLTGSWDDMQEYILLSYINYGEEISAAIGANYIDILMLSGEFYKSFVTGIYDSLNYGLEIATNFANGVIELANIAIGASNIAFGTETSIISKVTAPTIEMPDLSYDVSALESYISSSSEPVSLSETQQVTSTGVEGKNITQNITINNPTSSTAAETSKEYKKAAISLGTTATGA